MPMPVLLPTGLRSSLSSLVSPTFPSSHARDYAWSPALTANSSHHHARNASAHLHSHKRHHGNASWVVCDGPADLTPMARNRTCAYGNLLFYNKQFYLLGPSPHGGADIFLHNRFADGVTTGVGSHSRLHLQTLPAALHGEVGKAKVVSAPLFIGGDLHGNVGHNMLDFVFPAFAALVRIRAAAKARGLHNVLAALPAMGDEEESGDGASALSRGDDFWFLLYDAPPCCPGWHRGRGERAWAQTVAGTVVDLPQLTSECGAAGCLFPLAFGGVGHLGLCMVDRQNVIGGAREHRAMWAYRQRVFSRFGVPPIGLAIHKAPKLQVLLVATKRVVTNLAGLATSIKEHAAKHSANGGGGGLSAHEVTTRVVRWESLSFAEQLRVLSETAVQVAGVGTAQMNSFLLPAGAVALCLGWRHDGSKRRIEYFDSHILRSLDHVRALYYPSYEPSELTGSSVTLNLTKATELVWRAVRIAARGFSVPVPPDANANDHDRAFAYLNDLSGEKAVRARTAEEAFTPGVKEGVTHRCICNGVAQMLWGPLASRGCPWQPYIRQTIEAFGL